MFDMKRRGFITPVGGEFVITLRLASARPIPIGRGTGGPGRTARAYPFVRGFANSPWTGYWLAGPVIAKALHPPDRGTDADLELFGCFTSGSSSFHEANNTHSQLTRIRSMHWATLRRINALDSLLRLALGIPIHSGRDVL